MPDNGQVRRIVEHPTGIEHDNRFINPLSIVPFLFHPLAFKLVQEIVFIHKIIEWISIQKRPGEDADKALLQVRHVDKTIHQRHWFLVVNFRLNACRVRRDRGR